MSLAGSWISFCALRKIAPITPRLARQRFEQLAVFRRQRLARELLDVAPARACGQKRGLANQLDPLLVHLEEQQIGDLRNIGLVGDALVAQHMREVPDFGDEGFGVHGSLCRCVFRPPKRVGRLFGACGVEGLGSGQSPRGLTPPRPRLWSEPSSPDSGMKDSS